MTYQIEIEFNPLYELVSSMAVFMNPKSHYDLDKDWFRIIGNNVSPTFKENIQNEERRQEIGFLLILIWECPSKDSLFDFLHWLHTITVQEMHELLFPYFGVNSLDDLVAFRDYYTDILTSWNEVYSIEEKVTRALWKRTLLLKEESKAMNPVDFVENCTNGIRIYPLEDVHNVLLVPTFHSAPLNRIYELNHTLFVHFAVDLPNESSNSPSQSFIRKTKALADAKRLKILQLLASRPKTFTELGNEMKISSSNLHNHLVLLRTAGLIRITNYQFKQPELYETRQHGFTTLKDEMDAYIFDNSE